MNVATAWRSTRRSGSGPQAAATSTPSSSLAVSRSIRADPGISAPRRADSPAASVGDDSAGKGYHVSSTRSSAANVASPTPQAPAAEARASVTAGHGRRGTHCPARTRRGRRVACGPDGPVGAHRRSRCHPLREPPRGGAGGPRRARLRALAHLHVDRFGDNVVARTTAGRALRLVVAGHLDTVPVNDNGTPEIRDDVLWGSAPPT